MRRDQPLLSSEREIENLRRTHEYVFLTVALTETTISLSPS